jgi:hypothetical protein
MSSESYSDAVFPYTMAIPETVVFFYVFIILALYTLLNLAIAVQVDEFQRLQTVSGVWGHCHANLDTFSFSEYLNFGVCNSRILIPNLALSFCHFSCLRVSFTENHNQRRTEAYQDAHRCFLSCT